MAVIKKEYRLNQCEGNIKTCPIDRGGCGYRFLKTDPKWQEGGVCPKCGRDRRCERDKVIEKNVCQVHGGGSVRKGRPGGRPVVKGDLRSKVLPKQLRKHYESYLNDPTLLQLRNDIATFKARNDNLIERSEAEGSDHLWPLALDAFKQLRKADRRGSYEDKVKWESELQTLLESGNAEFLRWEEISRNTELIRRLTLAENKRLLEAEQVITSKQLMAFVAALTSIIETHVTDTHTRLAIGLSFQRLLALEEAPPKIVEVSTPM